MHQLLQFQFSNSDRFCHVHIGIANKRRYIWKPNIQQQSRCISKCKSRISRQIQMRSFDSCHWASRCNMEWRQSPIFSVSKTLRAKHAFSRHSMEFFIWTRKVNLTQHWSFEHVKFALWLTKCFSYFSFVFMCLCERSFSVIKSLSTVLRRNIIIVSRRNVEKEIDVSINVVPRSHTTQTTIEFLIEFYFFRPFVGTVLLFVFLPLFSAMSLHTPTTTRPTTECETVTIVIWNTIVCHRQRKRNVFVCWKEISAQMEIGVTAVG